MREFWFGSQMPHLAHRRPILDTPAHSSCHIDYFSGMWQAEHFKAQQMMPRSRGWTFNG
jgi:hypothetical protein